MYWHSLPERAVVNRFTNQCGECARPPGGELSRTPFDIPSEIFFPKHFDCPEGGALDTITRTRLAYMPT